MLNADKLRLVHIVFKDLRSFHNNLTQTDNGRRDGRKSGKENGSKNGGDWRDGEDYKSGVTWEGAGDKKKEWGNRERKNAEGSRDGKGRKDGSQSDSNTARRGFFNTCNGVTDNLTSHPSNPLDLNEAHVASDDDRFFEQTRFDVYYRLPNIEILQNGPIFVFMGKIYFHLIKRNVKVLELKKYFKKIIMKI